MKRNIQEKVYIMCSWCGWGKIHPSSFVTAYAALRPRDGFFHSHQEHMKDTYILQCSTVCKPDDWRCTLLWLQEGY